MCSMPKSISTVKEMDFSLSTSLSDDNETFTDYLLPGARDTSDLRHFSRPLQARGRTYYLKFSNFISIFEIGVVEIRFVYVMVIENSPLLWYLFCDI